MILSRVESIKVYALINCSCGGELTGKPNKWNDSFSFWKDIYTYQCKKCGKIFKTKAKFPLYIGDKIKKQTKKIVDKDFQYENLR